MKIMSPIYEEIVPKKKNQFSFEHLTEVIANSKRPSIRTQPFKDLVSPPLCHTYFTFEIQDNSLVENEAEALVLSVQEVNGVKVIDKKDILKLPPYLINILNKHYQKLFNQWKDYVMDNLKEYCETRISEVNWSIFNITAGKTMSLPLNFEQRLWVYVCSEKDKEFWLNTALSFEARLQPWLNNKMWSEVSKRKDNTRKNVDYEEQRRQMVEGSFGKGEQKEGIEETKVIRKTSVEEDLDIIK